MRLLKSPARVEAIALVETLVYIACLTIFMSIVSTAIWRLWSSQSLLTERADGLVKILNVGERWREDVRRSEIPPIVKGTQGISLQRDGNEYAYLLENGELCRNTDAQQEILARNVVSSQMLRQQKQGLVYWQWEVEVRFSRTSAKTQRFTFMAVPVTQPLTR